MGADGFFPEHTSSLFSHSVNTNTHTPVLEHIFTPTLTVTRVGCCRKVAPPRENRPAPPDEHLCWTKVPLHEIKHSTNAPKAPQITKSYFFLISFFVRGECTMRSPQRESSKRVCLSAKHKHFFRLGTQPGVRRGEALTSEHLSSTCSQNSGQSHESG